MVGVGGRGLFGTKEGETKDQSHAAIFGGTKDYCTTTGGRMEVKRLRKRGSLSDPPEPRKHGEDELGIETGAQQKIQRRIEGWKGGSIEWVGQLVTSMDPASAHLTS